MGHHIHEYCNYDWSIISNRKNLLAIYVKLLMLANVILAQLFETNDSVRSFNIYTSSLTWTLPLIFIWNLWIIEVESWNFFGGSLHKFNFAGYDSTLIGDNAVIVTTKCGTIQARVCETRAGSNAEVPAGNKNTLHGEPLPLLRLQQKQP